MAIPIYRHNLDHDDWEVASVYDSDGCDSLGRSAYNESLYSENSLAEPALRSQGLLHDETRFRFGYPMPQEQYQNYPLAAPTRPRWDTHYAPAKQSTFAPPPAPIVPPPGVIFPTKDWVLPPQDSYWPSTTSQMAPSSDMPVDVGLIEPPPPPLLLSPSSPPHISSPLTRRPSPTTTIAHGQPPHARSVTVSSTGTGANVNPHASPIMPPPPRYHELAHTISPRLAEAGCQAHSSMGMNSPRRSGHDVLSSYAPGPGHASTPRGLHSNEEYAIADGRYGGGGGPGGYPKYGPGDRPDQHPPLVSSTYGQEHEYDAGCTRRARPQRRERRPSIWQRFVRRFSPSRTSVGQT